ncbi:MAG: RHS repeat-associated core domain-containing protein, partial [Thermoanaerobaculia bacterium]
MAPILIAYDYHPDGRLHRVRNAETAVEYEGYDLLGRPGITRSIRYSASSGVTASPAVAESYTQRHSWSIHDGERSSWTMPATGTAVPQDDPSSPWLQTIVETRDAGANLVRQETPFGPLSESFGRSVGRLSYRKHSTGAATIATEFGFDDGLTTVTQPELPPVIVSQQPGNHSGMPLWSRTEVGTDRRAGSGVARDEAGRVGGLRDLGLRDRLSRWKYDGRGRLEDSWLLLRAKTAPTVPPSVDDTLSAADFRASRTTPSQFTAAQASRLGDTVLRIEPATWSATETSGHQIQTRTLLLAGTAQPARSYTFTGARRTKDGDWTYSFDSFGRMTSAESALAGRRVQYAWDPNDRLARRTAYEPDTSGWKLETRNTILERDGIPADTTFLWDPLTDRLVAVYARGGGIVRQYLHGDQAYDDPIEVRVAATPGGIPARYFPAIDHTGTGSLQAVLGVNGNVIERILYGDSYGDAPRYLQGPVADKMEITAKKAANGDLERITVRAHLSETIVASTVSTGTALRSVKSDQSPAHSLPIAPTLIDDATMEWTLTPAQWTALSTAPGAEALEIRLTDALRAEGWGANPVMPLPAWATTIYGGVATTATTPVIVREQLTTTNTWLAGITTESTRTLLELPSLYAAASEESRTKLLTDFHALPFAEPATGLVYARHRWIDPKTGTFLTPDPLGYQDSSNLYAFAGGDPVNGRDPTGEYEADAHHVLTGYLAQRAGFSAQDAATIAASTVGVDRDPATKPIDNARAGKWSVVKRNHFAIHADDERVRRNNPTARRGVESAATLQQLGSGLHVL